MVLEIIESLEELLSTRQAEGFEKIKAKISDQTKIDKKLFFYLFGVCSRWFDVNPVDLRDSKFLKNEDTFGVLSKWQWTSLARLYLIVVVAKRNSKEGFIQLIESLFNIADVQESIVLIQSLAFVPYSDLFVEKAREAARSNMTTLFTAIAHESDYASLHFDDLGWNQLVLKAAFLNVSIIGINGLKSRNNKALVSMLRDYASERKAASREVPWDLWCCIAWVAQGKDNLDYLKEQHSLGNAKAKAAIVLALLENKDEQASALGYQLLQSNKLDQRTLPLTWEALRTR